MLSYTGPWWCDVDGFGGGHASCGMLASPHAYAVSDEDCHGIDLGVGRDEFGKAAGVVAKCVLHAIEKADLVFAWIDSDDCLGTMLELGIAFQAGKVLVVASPPHFDQRETWLAARLAQYRVYASSAGDAWRLFWSESAGEAGDCQQVICLKEEAA